MSATALLFSLLLCLLLSALFSGSETGFYSLSRLRLEGDVRAGRRLATLVQRLVRDERGLLITILIGNNLMLELVTSFGDQWLQKTLGVPGAYRELLLTAVLTPVVFVFAELLPKDQFRRRPHSLLGLSAPLVVFSRAAFLPLALPLRWASALIERLLGVPQAALHELEGRVQILEVMEEGAKSGALAPHARQLMSNVLELRAKRVESVMIPWSEVLCLDLTSAPEEVLGRMETSEFSRLPVVDGPGHVAGYLHVLDVLSRRAGFEGRAAESGDLPETTAPGARWVRSEDPWLQSQVSAAGVLPDSGLLRPLLALEPSTPVDRALSILRAEGQRAALVGDPERPQGWLTLKDLVEEISGELGGW